MYTWGIGNRGQLGHGVFANESFPRLVQFDTENKDEDDFVYSISCGQEHMAVQFCKRQFILINYSLNLSNFILLSFIIRFRQRGATF